jgi:hypothetical protein
VTATYNGDANFTASTATAAQTVNQGSTVATVTSVPNPSVSGQAVTITASVAAVAPATGIPTGTITFDIAGGSTMTATVDATGVAAVTTSALSVGSHTVTATYNGDANFTASSGTAAQTVNQGSTVATVTSVPNPSVSGQAVTISASVAAVAPATGIPTGTVTFAIAGGSTLTATVDATGVAAVTTSELTAGSHTITATYTGDVNFAGSTATGTQTVNQGSTTTTVASAPNPSVAGQAVTITASVTAAAPATGTPTGTVVFSFAGGTTLTATVNASGVASVTTSSLTVGSHAITAAYSGDANFTASTGTGTQTVNQGSTVTTVASVPSPSVFGQAVTISASVAPVAPAAGIPSGTVTFTIANGPTLTATADGSGVASVTTSTLSVGSHEVAAAYSGDTSFTGSTGAGTQIVNQGSTATTVASVPSPSVFGQAITITASVAPVAPAAGHPTGTVTFTIANGPTLTGTVDGSGVASVTTSALSAGSHSVTAAYSGDASFTASTGTTTQTVNPAATVLALASTPNPSVYGQTATFTASVTAVAPGAGVPSGTVTFTIANGPVLTGTLDASGVATVTTSALSAGSHAITAAYSGSDNFSASTATGTQTVTPKTLTVTGVIVETKTFDNSASATLNLTGAALQGVVGSDDVTLVKSNVSATFADAAAGSAKPVTITGFALAGSAAPNYTLVQPSATGNIISRALIIIPYDQTKTEGDADPILSYQAVGDFATPPTFTGALSREPGESVGQYAITLGTLSAGDNYTIDFRTAHLTIKSGNTPPVASDDTYTATQDTALDVAAPGVLANDTDADHDSVTAAIATAPVHGTVTLNSDGSFHYVPNDGYNGGDSFTYRAMDAQTNSQIATVHISVSKKLEELTLSFAPQVFHTLGAPFTLLDTNAAAAGEKLGGTTITFTVVTNASNGDVLAIQSEGTEAGEIATQDNAVMFGGATFAGWTSSSNNLPQPPQLMIQLHAGTTLDAVQALARSIAFTSTNQSSATRVIEVAVSNDGQGSTNYIEVLINHAPVVGSIREVFAQNSIGHIPVSALLAVASDLDGDEISFVSAAPQSTAGAQVSVVDSTLIYTPAASFIGTDVVQFTVQDSRGGQTTAAIDVHVLATGTLAAFSAGQSTPEGQGKIELYAGAIPGNTYDILVSNDLLHWELLTTVVATEDGLLQFLDEEVARNPHRFYRTRTH